MNIMLGHAWWLLFHNAGNGRSLLQKGRLSKWPQAPNFMQLLTSKADVQTSEGS